MKNIFLVAIAIVVTYTISIAQTKTPVAVSSAFASKFPGATKVKWGKEGAHEFEAEFEMAGMKNSANYSEDGKWLETETGIKYESLPEKVRMAFEKSHKSSEVKETSSIETSKGRSFYEIEIKQGIKTVELFYSADGASVKE